MSYTEHNDGSYEYSQYPDHTFDYWEWAEKIIYDFYNKNIVQVDDLQK